MVINATGNNNLLVKNIHSTKNSEPIKHKENLKLEKELKTNPELENNVKPRKSFNFNKSIEFPVKVASLLLDDKGTMTKRMGIVGLHLDKLKVNFQKNKIRIKAIEEFVKHIGNKTLPDNSKKLHDFELKAINWYLDQKAIELKIDAYKETSKRENIASYIQLGVDISLSFSGEIIAEKVAFAVIKKTAPYAFKYGGQALSKFENFVQSSTSLTPGKIVRLLGLESKKTVINATRLSKSEIKTGERLMENRPWIDLKQGPHKGEEFIDQWNRTYDAMGSKKASDTWANAPTKKLKNRRQKDFIKSIDHHLSKSNDFTIIDLSDFRPDQKKVIQNYIKKLPKTDQSRIIKVGF